MWQDSRGRVWVELMTVEGMAKLCLGQDADYAKQTFLNLAEEIDEFQKQPRQRTGATYTVDKDGNIWSSLRKARRGWMRKGEVGHNAHIYDADGTPWYPMIEWVTGERPPTFEDRVEIWEACKAWVEGR